MQIGSPNPVTGPTASLKWLNPVPRDGNQVADWRMGFTPNKPLFAINGELTGWQRPDGSTVTEDRNGTPTNVVNLPEEEYVSLDYHQYETDTSTLGFEQGEQWRAFIHPFREDFRVGNSTRI